MDKELNKTETMTAEEVWKNTAIMIAIAGAEPDHERAEEELGGLISSLTEREEWLQSMLEVTRNAKKRAVRALYDVRINATSIALADK